MPTKTGTGVIIGRFQTYRLNAEHERLIDSVLSRHPRVVVFLGSNPAPTERNPLDFKWRVDLFAEKYRGRLEVHEMPDVPDDRIWSQELDRRILELRPEGEVTIYGTRHGVIEPYSGRYRTKLLTAKQEGEILDLGLGEEGIDPKSFRAGVIYAMLCRFPTAFATVDVALLRHDGREVLLARKEAESRWRFPGGFADPDDDSFEMAALRELVEECGEILIENMSYLGSWRMDDWRYRDTMDSVITHFYACDHAGGEPVASDDIAELRWVETAKLTPEILVPEHRPLAKLLEAFLAE